MVGKGRNKFSFLASTIFLFWFILLSLYFSSLNSDKSRAVLVDTFDLESDGNSNEMATKETEDAGGSMENLKSVEEAEASNLTTESTPDEEIRLTENVARSTNKALGEGSPELSGDAVHDKENGTGKVLDTIPEQGRPVAEVGHEVTTNSGGDSQVQPGMEDGDEGVVSNPGPDLGKSCSGRFIYVHDLPSQFNEDLLKHCRSLDQWRNMCPFVSNFGLGPRLRNSSKLFSNTGWFETNQFTLEIIFHNRMKQYKCLTNDSSVASAIFVPYYAGLDVARYLWNSSYLMRDHYSESLVKWISERPEWRRMWGRDHFLVAGRISWDFLRLAEGNSDWGNKLLRLPQSRNMTILTTESSPWNNNDFAIPYPTYFHPSSDNEVLRWQKRMRRIKRRYLFSFVGGRRPNITDSIRGEIIDQCHAARKKCRFLECSLGPTKCHSPENVMKTFQGSSFCLQPPGDSYTRRSTFDSILAGCIPVFFHPGSAYVQYLWHLPRDYNKYSVFIPENQVKEGKASIERILSRIPTAKLLAMRKQVINLIPGVVYADPTSQLQTLKDAFDITINGVLERIEGIRRDIREGKNVFDDSGEEFTWKKNLLGTVEKHEWDSFFNRP